MDRTPRLHSDLLAAVVIGGLATGLRAAFLLRAPVFITNDGLSYLLPGFELISELGFEPIFKRTPGYPVFISGALWFFGQQDLVGLLALQHLLGVATALLAYRLGTRLFGRPAGWIAGLLTALSGPLIVTEHYLLSESLFGFLLSATLLAAVMALQTRRSAWLGACGVLLGFAALTRPVGQLLLPLLVLLCLASWRRSNGQGGEPPVPGRARDCNQGRETPPLPLAAHPHQRPLSPLAVGRGWVRGITPLSAAALLILCYGITVLPWMVRNVVVQHSFTLAGGLGEGLAVRTIRLGQDFDFRAPSPETDTLRSERTIYREEAREGSVFELARRLREEAALTPSDADRAMRDIALQGMARKPGYYVLGSLDMFKQMFAGRQVRLAQDWQPWRGIQWHERVAHLFPANTSVEAPAFNQAQALATMYDPARWPLLVGLLFGFCCLASVRRVDRWIALLPALSAVALLLASAFLVGIEWRYRHPLEPLINVMVSGGVVAIGFQLTATARRVGGRLTNVVSVADSGVRDARRGH